MMPSLADDSSDSSSSSNRNTSINDNKIEYNNNNNNGNIGVAINVANMIGTNSYKSNVVTVPANVNALVEEDMADDDDDDDDDDDWEEWDGTSPFWIHCTAGSIAGVIEHSATYPLDTVRTHIQVCAACIERHNQLATMNAMKRNAVSGTTSASAINTTASSVNHPSTLLKSVLANATANNCKVPTTTATATGGPVRTHLPLGMWQTIRYLVNEPILHGGGGGVATATATIEGGLASANSSSSNRIPSTNPTSLLQGWSRLWRGVQSVVIGCIPAHALYFSSYEVVKSACTDQQTGTLPAWGSSAAGAVAAFGHDIVMTPLDTIKQRMQLGYHTGVLEAIRSIVSNESYVALYRSFPVTLATNIPYGMIMVTTNETCKAAWISTGEHTNQRSSSSSSTTGMIIMSSSIAGLVASAITTPLDRIKTALQTQQLAPNCIHGRALMMTGNYPAGASKSTISTSSSSSLVCRNAAVVAAAAAAATATTTKSQPATAASTNVVNHHTNWYQAAKSIYVLEGSAGFFRGMIPRVLSHTPAVAISWTTYETVKQYLMTNYHNENHHHHSSPSS